MKNPLKPKGHWIQNRGWEITIGILVFAIGSMLLWDAFDNRGRKMPWAAGVAMPW